MNALQVALQGLGASPLAVVVATQGLLMDCVIAPGAPGLAGHAIRPMPWPAWRRQRARSQNQIIVIRAR